MVSASATLCLWLCGMGTALSTQQHRQQKHQQRVVPFSPTLCRDALPEPPAPLGARADNSEDRNPFTDAFKQYALEKLAKWHLPGMALAVLDGEDTFFEGLGLADIASNTSVTPDTLFMTGSTTKAFTDAAIGLLIASGNYTVPAPPNSPSGATTLPLSWRTPISAILPSDFVLEDSWATAHVTLEDAASHRSGLSRHDKSMSRRYPDPVTGELKTATPRDVVRSLRYLPMAQEPRSTFQYCNLMYAVLSHCVETLVGDGKTLGDVLRERIWGPLGMTSTFYGVEDLSSEGGERFAKGYYWDEMQEKTQEIAIEPTPEIAGAGLVISSVRDYAKWVRSQLEEGGPLDKATHAALRLPKSIDTDGGGVFDAPATVASGWFVASYKGNKVIFHNGMMESHGALVVFFPGAKYGVIAMGNSAIEATVVSEILVWGLVDNKLGVPEERRHPWEVKWETLRQQLDALLANAVDVLFPDRTSDPLPPSLPIDKYVGTYYHPAYQNMTLELGDGTAGSQTPVLKADRTAFSWQTMAKFEHVSGEHWIMYSRLAKAPTARVLADLARVEFKIGVDGKVTKMGVEWGDTFSGVVDGWIWYDRID